jgi:hypothetical protein
VLGKLFTLQFFESLYISLQIKSMMKIVICTLFLVATHSLFSQRLDIKFYHNTKSVKIKSLIAFTISGGDTIHLKAERTNVSLSDNPNLSTLFLGINGKTICYKRLGKTSGGELSIFEIDDISKFTPVPDQLNLYRFGNYNFLITNEQKDKKLYSFVFSEGSKNVNGNMYSSKTSGYTIVVE